ncbi:MAG: cell division protein ZapA [Rhodospirillales bacterium]|nr:cell division protein ZapA [Rhodospirillales bacterium]
MEDVKLAINGRMYAIACDDGQERRVSMLGRYIDARLKEIGRAGGASNESHLLVLTALVLADEIHDLREDLENTMRALRLKNIEAAKRESESPENAKMSANSSDSADLQIADAINGIARKIAAIADRVDQKAA